MKDSEQTEPGDTDDRHDEGVIQSVTTLLGRAIEVLARRSTRASRDSTADTGQAGSKREAAERTDRRGRTWEDEGEFTPGDATGEGESTPDDTTDEGDRGIEDVDPELLDVKSRIYQLLVAEGGEMTQSAIVERTRWSGSTVSRHLSEMESEGWVQRGRHGPSKSVQLVEEAEERE